MLGSCGTFASGCPAFVDTKSAGLSIGLSGLFVAEETHCHRCLDRVVTEPKPSVWSTLRLA